MDITNITRSAIIIAAYPFAPVTEQMQTYINYDYKQPVKNNTILNLFKEYKAKLGLSDLAEKAAFTKFKNALNIIFQSEEQYKVGAEFTNDKTIFITSIFEENDSELHLELYFGEEEENDAFFAMYTGEEMIDTGIYPFDVTKSKVEKAIAETSKQTTPLLIPS